MMFRRLLATSLLLAVAAPAWADGAKTFGKFGDWSAFMFADKNGKVCYAVSSPKRSISSPKGRAEAYVTITHRPADKSFDVVSVTQGYQFKKDSVPEFDIGGARFDLFTQENTAWTRNDKAVVQALLKGKNLIMHGQPQKGEASADTYSLEGFPKAYTEIGKACGK